MEIRNDGKTERRTEGLEKLFQLDRLHVLGYMLMY